MQESCCSLGKTISGWPAKGPEKQASGSSQAQLDLYLRVCISCQSQIKVGSRESWWNLMKVLLWKIDIARIRPSERKRCHHNCILIKYRFYKVLKGGSLASHLGKILLCHILGMFPPKLSQRVDVRLPAELLLVIPSEGGSLVKGAPCEIVIEHLYDLVSLKSFWQQCISRLKGPKYFS
jgi:hypothetical protein